jgi:geranylgeranyl diphosphate synthase type I
MQACIQGSDPGLNSLLQATELFIRKQTEQVQAERLRDLIQYHLESGGARVRAQLALSTGRALQLPESTCIALAASCELLHNASLLHDDIQDGDRMRRGRLSAWCAFDTNTAMCAGTFLLSAACAALLTACTPSCALLKHLHQRTADLISGQTLDLDARRKSSSVAMYCNIAAQKSGSLLALPIELAMISAQQTTHLYTAKKAGESFAIAYQIIDDLQDMDADRVKGHNNLVNLMVHHGATRTESIASARTLAKQYLIIAMDHAAVLPENSGAFLINLCRALATSTLNDHEINCEVS